MEISNPIDYKAALYIRLSKEDDNESESQSVTNQRSILQDFSEKHRLHVYDEYVDGGVIIGQMAGVLSDYIKSLLTGDFFNRLPYSFVT